MERKDSNNLREARRTPEVRKESSCLVEITVLEGDYKFGWLLPVYWMRSILEFALVTN